MKSIILADVILEVVNAGHVKAGGRKLQQEDMLQLVYMANAAMVEARLQAARDRGEVPNLEDMLQRVKLDVKKGSDGRTYVELPADPISLPDNMGIFSVLPISDEAQFCNPVIRQQPGSEWLFCRDTGGVATFIPYGKRLVLYGLGDCYKTVEVAFVGNNQDSEINDSVALDIARLVWREVLRTITIPVDKIADGNPNWDEIFKTRISSPQTT